MNQIETIGTPRIKQHVLYIDEIGIVEFQPKFSRLFIPESLGIPLWTYVEFLKDDLYKNCWHIISESVNLKNSRRVSPNKNSDKQEGLRKKKNSFVTVDFPELQKFLDMPNKNDISKNDPLNQTHFLNACISTFHLKMGNQWLPGVRRGITIDLDSIRTIR